MSAFIPSLQQIENAWFFTCVLLAIAVALGAVAAVCDGLMDRYVARFLSEPTPEAWGRDAEAARRRQLLAIVRGRQ